MENGVRPSYPCLRAAEPIHIDGLLTEPTWQRAPSFALAETAGGAPAPRRYAIKMLRDDRYLYVGFEIEDSDVWARCGYRDEECGPDFAKRANWHPSGSAEFQRLEADFHSCDKFVKFFLDPDEDGADYLEFQISPVNNFLDAVYPCGYDTPEGGTERQENLTWKCGGLISATRVDGTLNSPHDQDKGWSAEIAMPWTALARFCKGAYPPAAGDWWLTHVAYVDRTAFRQPRTYWTWPVIGVVQRHMPKTWGRLVFDGSSCGSPRARPICSSPARRGSSRPTLKRPPSTACASGPGWA